AWLLVAVLLLLFAANLSRSERRGGDLRIYRESFQRARAGLDLYYYWEDPGKLAAASDLGWPLTTGTTYPPTFAVLGIPFGFLPFRALRATWCVLAGTLGALAFVLVFGAQTFGAQRSFFNGSVQPSELAKFVTIIYLAVWLDSKGEKIREMSYGMIPFGVIVGLVAGLILLQPDLSAAATVVMVATLMFFISGADLFQMGVVSLFSSAAAVAVLQVSETGRQRLADYLAGLQDLTRASWHMKQAAIAFVNGGVFGRGLGESHQKFGFLPTPHTDSIFAIIGEELGLLGCLFVITLFALLIWRGFKIAARAKDPLGAILASGIVCWVGLEALINMAVMAGVMPFAGNALPFISYGGSNLVMILLAMGVLLNISRRDEHETFPRKTRPAGQLRRSRLRGEVEVPRGQAGRAQWEATVDLGRRDRGGRLSRVVGRPNTDR
ncbi:MAG: cell division protein FtsW, partial [Chloroflexi bacterium]|nr:cell division protein FtsW [Chloroflexota bacterium]